MGWLERALTCSPQRKETTAFTENVTRFQSRKDGECEELQRTQVGYLLQAEEKGKDDEGGEEKRKEEREG
jgi:hypothetical protein